MQCTIHVFTSLYSSSYVRWQRGTVRICYCISSRAKNCVCLQYWTAMCNISPVSLYTSILKISNNKLAHFVLEIAESLQHWRGKKVANTRLPSVGFRSWSRFLAVSLQVTWVINPTVGCHYFPPGLQLAPQPLRGLLPILLLGDHRHNGCEQFA